MTNGKQVRYSTGKKDIGDAARFSWEYPVPDNEFWNSLDFGVGRNFLNCFTSQEIDEMSLDETLNTNKKLELLQSILQHKLTALEAIVAPRALYDADHRAWEKILLAMYTVQRRLERTEVDGEAERIVTELVERRKDKSNMSHPHVLADLYIEQGRFAEAEAIEKQVQVWLDEKLGPCSPQALNARRIIAKAVWNQGPNRRSEAQDLLEEITKLTEGVSETDFKVYQDEERRLNDELKAHFKAGSDA